MIKTIVFDLGGVYLTNGMGKAVELISENYSVDKDKVRKALTEGPTKELRRGKISEAEFWNKNMKDWGIEEDPLFLSHVWASGYVPREELVEVIKELRRVNYKLYFLSNFFEEWIESFEGRHHFIENFDGGIFSCRVGCAKPEREIYERLLDKIGGSPNEILFVDDEGPNIEPAKKLGMQTILFKNTEQLINELNKLGVKF